MKIALVIDHFHPRKGGAERSLEEILTALHRRGHLLNLVAMSWDAPLPDWLVPVRVSAPAFPRWRKDIAFAKNSSAALKSLSPDLVLGVRHTLDVDVFLARGGLYLETLEANLDAKPSVWRKLAQGILPKHRVLLNLERRLFTQPSPPLVIAPSRLIRDHCIRHFRLPSDRVLVVPNGIDLERYRPATADQKRELRRELGLGEQVVLIFSAHNFRLKGLDCLLKAWQRLDPKQFHLLIAGRDRPPREAARFTNVRFLGNRPDSVRLYQTADVLVHPTFYDTFGRVVLEGLACGLPVITTRLAGASELMTDGREGYVLDHPRQVEMLADRMARFADPALLQRCSLAARALAERYPESAYLNQTVAAIEAEAYKVQRKPTAHAAG